MTNTDGKMSFLPQGTRIKMKEGQPLPGVTGTIVGCSTQGQPIIGASYMVRADDPSQVVCQGYPYDTFPAFECQFDTIKLSDSKTLVKRLAETIDQALAGDSFDESLEIEAHDVLLELANWIEETSPTGVVTPSMLRCEAQRK